MNENIKKLLNTAWYELQNYENGHELYMEIRSDLQCMTEEQSYKYLYTYKFLQKYFSKFGII